MAHGLTTHSDRTLHEIVQAAVRRQRFAQISADPRAYTVRVDIYSGKCACRDNWLFAVTRLDDRWFLLLNIWNCFEFRTQNDLVPVAEWILDSALEGCTRPELLQRLKDHPSLTENPEYHEHPWRLRMRYWAQFGWEGIARREEDELDLWNLIHRNFGFPYDAPKFPKGFRRWNVARWFRRSRVVKQRAVRAYHKAIVDALCASLSRNETVLVMDWQHPCYRFKPHKMTRAAADDTWPVSLDSEGDPILMTAEDFRSGVFADVSDHTVTLWDARFVNAVLAQHPEFLLDESRDR